MADKKIKFFLVGICVLFLSGCAVLDKAQRTDDLSMENLLLKKKIDRMARDHEDEMAALRHDQELELRRIADENDARIAEVLSRKEKTVRQIKQEKNRELSDLERAKEDLEKRLSKELGEYRAKLKMTERGLVVTFLSEIFFAPGLDVIGADGQRVLGEVAAVIQKDVPDSRIAVEGHTDNDPIRKSSWKSNWELSSARALAVVHFLIDQAEVKPERLSAVGFGQFDPVASNDTPEGKQQNRRVEIVILPSQLTKVKFDEVPVAEISD